MSQQTPLRLLRYRQVVQNQIQKEMKNLKFQQSPGGTSLHQGPDFVCANTRGAKTQGERRIDDFLCLAIALHHLTLKLITKSVEA